MSLPSGPLLLVRSAQTSVPRLVAGPCRSGRARHLRSPPPSSRRAFFGLPDFLPFSAPGSSRSDGGVGDGPGRKGKGSERKEGDLTIYSEQRTLPYTQQQLYNVVADVDSYFSFIPFCTSSEVLAPASGSTSLSSPSSSDDPDTQTRTVLARLTVGFNGLNESYVSRVECRPYELVKATADSSTPLFKTLRTTWRFQPSFAPSTSPTSSSSFSSPSHPTSAASTLLSFDLAYSFANPLYGQVSSLFFGRIAELMVEAFEKRCKDVYGP